MSYLIGSGFSYRSGADKAKEFFEIWLKTIHRFAKPAPSRIVVVCVGGAIPDMISDDVDVIQLEGNLGHGHHLIGKETPAKPHAYSGWSGAFLSTAMLAYCNESDLLWQEQDCLAFGDYVGEMYRAMGTKDLLCGGPMKAQPFMPTHQSLVLLRHSAIPEFVTLYLLCGDERDPRRLVEHKFDRITKTMGTAFLPDHFMDRMRPIPWDKLQDHKAWSAQQFTDSELDELRKRGLI